MFRTISALALGVILALASWCSLRADNGETAAEAKPAGAATALLAGSEEWAKGIKIHTSWEDAIKECRSTGKLLFIYNGWKREKV